MFGARNESVFDGPAPGGDRGLTIRGFISIEDKIDRRMALAQDALKA